ncbi:MAG: hypothetical protein RPR97_15925 [Colwellia sp.]|jgi:hypothetical protein
MIDFKMEVPTNVDELKVLASDRTSYKNRKIAIESLGKYKCQQSKDILWRLMISDKVHSVQYAAFIKLQAFGEDVKAPKKKKGHLVKDINKKLGKVKNSLQENFSSEEFNEKFKTMYPEAFDIYSFEKNGKFNQWVDNILKSLPKK